MPERIRSHELEEYSFAYLRTIFPKSWIIHKFERDYGTDVQVELFAENGDRTGIRFYGQLKGTDKNENEDLLRLDRSHFEYWAGHTDPVALIRYFDKTKQFRWCWLHDVDWQMKPGSNSVDVSNLLKVWQQDTSPTEIEKYLHSRRQALFEPLMPPYVISIEQLDDNRENSAVLAAKIAQLIGSNSFRVLPKTVEPGNFQLLFAPGKIVSSYCGLPGLVFHHKDDSTEDEVLGTAMLAIFLCACRYERILFARSLVGLLAPLLYRISRDEIRFNLLDAMIFSLGLKAAVALISPILAKEKDPSAEWFIFSGISAQASWRYGEDHSYIELLQQWTETPPFPNNAGAFFYNLANSLAHKGRWLEARVAYASALSKDSAYSRRAYFWAESAAASFEAGHFEDAIQYYEAALDLESSVENRWRLADAQFNSGKYQAAYQQLNKILPDETYKAKDYACLVHLICAELVNFWKIKSQTCQMIPEQDFKLLESVEIESTSQGVIELLKPMMDKNAIDERLNFNAGIVANKAGQYLLAAHLFLTCALRQRNDTKAWMNAVACAMNANDVSLAFLAAKVAHFYLNEQFLPEIQKLAVGMSVEDADAWSRLVTEITCNFEQSKISEREAPLIRIHSPFGTKLIQLQS